MGDRLPVRPRALVTDGGTGQGRSALAAVRSLAAAGWEPVVTVTGPLSLAGASRRCAGTRRLPGVAAGVGSYSSALAELVSNEGFDAVVPASDAAVEALGLPATTLLDKAGLAAAADEAGLRTPPSRDFASWTALLSAADDLGYPIVVKPRRTTEPARAFASATALREARSGVGPMLVQPRVDDGMWAVAGVVHDGRLVAALHQRYLRTWPVACGTASAAVTVAPDPSVEPALERLLAGHQGVFQAQFVGDFLLDVNPRAYGSLPLAVAAGVNLVALACDLSTGRTRPPVEILRARPGVRYRWLEGDLRHVLSGLRQRTMSRREVAQALRPHGGTAHSVTLATDPAPLVARVAHALRAGR